MNNTAYISNLDLLKGFQVVESIKTATHFYCTVGNGHSLLEGKIYEIGHIMIDNWGEDSFDYYVTDENNKQDFCSHNCKTGTYLQKTIKKEI